MFSVVCFVFGVILCYLVLTYSDGMSSESLTRVFKAQETKILLLEKRMANFDESMKVKIQLLQNMTTQYQNMCHVSGEAQAEIKSLYEYCEKLKLQQIELQDKLSNKRPIVVLRSEIPVQVIKGKGINSLIKSKH